MKRLYNEMWHFVPVGDVICEDAKCGGVMNGDAMNRVSTTNDSGRDGGKSFLRQRKNLFLGET